MVDQAQDLVDDPVEEVDPLTKPYKVQCPKWTSKECPWPQCPHRGHHEKTQECERNDCTGLGKTRLTGVQCLPVRTQEER